MKRLLLLFSILLVFFRSEAQTVLAAGDLAVIAHNNDNADQIIIVTLVPVLQGTVISITDNAWNGSALTTSEGSWTYTFQSNLSAGTRISLFSTSPGVVISGTWDLSTSGDQIFIYQGAASNPKFIYGLSSRAWVTGSTSLTTSRLPATLINGKSARDFATEVDNGYYNLGTTAGTKDEILLQIGNTSRWTRSNSRYSSFPQVVFSVTPVNTTAEPASQPSAFSASSVQTWTFQVSWAAPAMAPEGYLVLRSLNGEPVTDIPADGVEYTTGDQIGNSKVAFSGSGTSFTQKGSMAASRMYRFAVFSYNGAGTSRNYLQTSPLTGSVLTPATGEGNYYASVSTSSATFVSDLQNRIRNPYTVVDYALFDETMVANFEFADTSSGQKVAACVYSGQRFVYTPPFAWTPTTPFSREHTWCHSWMPSSTSTSTQEYADQHHLFVVNQNNANAVRSNHPLGEVVNVSSSFLGGAYGTDAAGNTVYEPIDSHKGNAARALLYMSLRYNGVNGTDWSFSQLNNAVLPSLNEDPQDLQLLLQWHLQDPPDGVEIARNDYIQSIQGNRNPFVDRPDWVNLIDFNTVSAKYAEVSIGQSKSECSISAFPNPFTEQLTVVIGNSYPTSCRFTIYSYDGRIVYSSLYDLKEGINRLDLGTLDLKDGFYFLTAEAQGSIYSTRVVRISGRP
jgi:endonuclease I